MRVRYLVNVQETYVVEADSEDAVYDVPRESWEYVDSDVMVVGEA